ncbi:hypothetical protein ZIOFF_070986 [Zingiber officinale]|uniref:Peroxidase n=1 Tax=Zingiber officinale TaxID=94328 RepID=A0A8J5ETD9_ZINOF|nr:hypothetical protein ZIOFF_070986 [Zingiber officinale]
MAAVASMAAAQLSSTFYDSSCPDVLTTIQTAVQDAVNQEARMGASLLRLHFHDCFGCDGSVLLDDTANFTGEKTAPPNNNSIRGFDVVDTIKSQVEADRINSNIWLQLGGPSWTVQLGRRDATTASFSTASSDLPSPLLSLSGLISAFSNKGLSTTDMVALSGGHTIGQARCVSFRNRIYNENNINPSFAASTQANCPSVAGNGDDTLSPLDVQSPTIFDNFYFQGLVNQTGLLHSDQQLFNGGSTDSLVSTYSTDMAGFFNAFAAAMVNMGNISPLTGSNGEIRIN